MPEHHKAAQPQPQGARSWWPLILKYLFAFALVAFAFHTTGSKRIVLHGLIELSIIFFVSNMVAKRNRPLGNIINDVLIFVFNAQYLIMGFSGSFISMVMLTNIDSIQALGGRLPTYIAGVVLVVALSLLPIRAIGSANMANANLLACALAAELVLMLPTAGIYSPFYSAANLVAAQRAQSNLAAQTQASDLPDRTYIFAGKTRDCYKRQDGLAERPNVILIFTEGLSQRIISDERDIMPNIKRIQNESVQFTDYYNHTYATYNGIIGQLYSGYQLHNYDTNTLPSLQSILKEQGYYTSFINTEPKNIRFISYLESMGFDDVISDASIATGRAESITDKVAYELLFDTITEQAQSSNRPFLTCMYSFGTHLSFDSPDEKFGDGDNAFLNKFHNLDAQFGTFIERLNESDLAKNTVVVFTSDHATYTDDKLRELFSDLPDTGATLDEIPLFFYYKGVTPESFLGGGRNSLDLAPSILDFIDVGDDQQSVCFLGISLWLGMDNNRFLDTVYYDADFLLTTDDDNIAELDPNIRPIVEQQLEDYFIAKTQVFDPSYNPNQGKPGT